MCIGDLGKGWFDVNEKLFDIYEISKLKRFMELVKQRMQHTLRLLVENTLQLFINLVETPCLPCLSVEEDFIWGEDLINSPFISTAPPIFTLLLKMDETGAFYSTTPEAFGMVLLKLFDEALKQTHQIRQVHPLLLTNLRFPADLYLSSVGLLADEVCNVRQRFLLAYEKAIIPLKAYAKEFDVHVNLYTLSISDYIKNYEIDQKSAAEVKEDISQHFRLKKSLEETLPNLIFIGPFYVQIDHLRMFLINKRQEIINKMLDLFCARMKISVEELLQEYKNIMVKLAVKPESIEHIFEIRDWIETVPMSVKSLDETCKRYILEYEVLDHFWYALPNEDFDNKWEAIGWPLRIYKQVEEHEKYLKDEEDRFFKLQLNDEFTLNDRIDTLTTQVVNMSGYREIEKTQEYATEIRKVWKAMKEAQEFGQLLNQRQKLFGAPVVPFDILTKLIKEFEPYKNLWITASDWERSHEMWMDNPILNVDADAIEGTVTDMYKMMVRLTRVFADIEGVQLH